ncbi:proton-coupled zinc antiporter SLC30A5-like [Diadema antillarum]|uniref:proton-coupled zinc antiporter SLC30A5-like n=1 Tax=Diadema antillarum TaxID=105358 RepID=UPI003A8C525B
MLGSQSSLGRVQHERLAPYIILLLVTKCLQALGIFISYDVLKLVHLVIFVFIIKAGSGAVLCVLQRPLSSGRRLTKHQWIRVTRHAIFQTCISVLWIFGLTLCGPLRTILLFEHSDIVVSGFVAALFTSRGGGPSRTRGGFMFLVAILCLLLFDVDLQQTQEEHPEGPHRSAITHIFYRAISWLGVSDHKGGVILLVALLFVKVAFKNTSRKLSVDVGGTKRLHALSTIVSAVVLLPWTLIHLFVHQNGPESWSSLLLPFTALILVLCILDYYVESICVNHLETFRTARFSGYALFVSGLVLSYYWASSYSSGGSIVGRVVQDKMVEHALSGGVVFSALLFILATRILGYPIPKASSKGSLVGYTAGGLPLYTFTGDSLQRTSQSLISLAKNFLRQILESYDSRQIFYYLCINLVFTFVELLYGVWTNSLGLISDGFHMLFDCTALVLGLCAAVMSHWKATRIYSFGFGRAEVLSGFVNGLFLVVIGCFVFTAAIGRLLDPPDINTDKLMTVSVAGLIVNLIGIMAFSHAHTHSHGGGTGSSHGHSHSSSSSHHGHSHSSSSSSHHGHSHSSSSSSHHGHSHSGNQSSHGHSHHHHGVSASQDSHHHGQEEKKYSSPCQAKNTNMQGVFLHVLADTMGSVGVIISAFLVENFGLLVADPICSIFISIMILISVGPLLRDTAAILLQRIPPELESGLNECLFKVRSIQGVLSYRNPHFWRHTGDLITGTLHIQVEQGANEQKIIQQVTAVYKEQGVANLTVQVEKEAFFQHMSGLSASFDQVLKMNSEIQAIGHQDNQLYDIKAV